MNTILIVDDNEQNRYLLRVTLAASGHQVLEAANGSTALELARRTRPDLIISDILMPQMDGFALCRECKRDETLRDIPFVFYTATYTDPRDQELGLQLGAARFIIKPTESEEFIAIVHQVLKEHAAGQLVASLPPLEEETVFYRLYNEALVRKLEDKMLELERTNRQLAESERHYKTLAQISPVGIFQTDPEGRVVYVNPAWCKISGMSCQAATQEGDWLNAVHPDDRERIYQDWKDTRERRRASVAEFRFLRPDRTTAWVIGQVVPELNAEGQIAGYIGTITDITSRKRAEEEARLLQTIVLGIGEAQTLDEAYAFVLRHVCETTGWIMAEAWIPDRDGQHLECHLAWHRPAAQLEKFWQASQRYRFAAGESLPGRVWQSRKPLWLEDVETTDHFLRHHEAAAAGLRAAFGVPVMAHGEVILVMVFFLAEPQPEDRRMVELVSAVAAQIGMLIERRQAEVRALRLSRLYATLSQINQAIVRIKDRDRLFAAICRAVVEHGGFGLAWIGLFDRGSGQLKLTTAHGVGQEHLPCEPINLAEPPFDESLMAEAIRSGKIVYRSNIQSDPAMQRWYEEGVASGLHSAAAVPIRLEGEIIGLLNLYAADVDFFGTAEQQSLLNEMALDIAFALDTIASECQQRQTEEQLRFQAKLLDAVGQAVIVTDAAGVVSYMNRAAQALYGWSIEEARGCNILEVTVPQVSREQAIEIMAQLTRGESWSGEFLVQDRSGRVFPAFVYDTPIFDEQGQLIGIIGISHDISERKRAEQQIQEQLVELRRWHSVTLGREERVVELKREVNELLAQLGQPARYPSVA